VQDRKTQSDLLKWVGKASNNSISYRVGVPHDDYQLIFGPKNNASTSVRLGSGPVGSTKIFSTSGRVGLGQKILTDFEFYIRQIAGLDEIMILLL
jgi:hypothetical protein